MVAFSIPFYLGFCRRFSVQQHIIIPIIHMFSCSDFISLLLCSLRAIGEDVCLGINPKPSLMNATSNRTSWIKSKLILLFAWIVFYIDSFWFDTLLPPYLWHHCQITKFVKSSFHLVYFFTVLLKWQRKLRNLFNKKHKLQNQKCYITLQIPTVLQFTFTNS